MTSTRDISNIMIERSQVIAPVTALASVDVNIGQKSGLVVYAGCGGYLAIHSYLDSVISVSLELFGRHSVHGVKVLSNNDGLRVELLVWGDKSMVIVHHSYDSGTLSIVSAFNDLDDLVLDCHLLSEGKYVGCLVVGYAHNFVDVMSIKNNELRRIFRCQCPAISVLFSLSFYGTDLDGLVTASGTAFGEIYLWSILLDTTETSATANILSRTKNHEGVVFRIKWREDGKNIASVSDDRTVRVWDVKDLSCPKEISTGWGHISRLWDASFLNINDIQYVATCSEDSTLKLWDCGESRSLCRATLRGHEGSVWRLISCSGGKKLLSGGNDGAIKSWDVKFHINASAENFNPGHYVNFPSIPVPSTSDDVKQSSSTIDQSISDLTVFIDSTKTVSRKSQRNKGVCLVSIHPTSNYCIIVLNEGTVWLLDLSNIAGNELWVDLVALPLPIATSDVVFLNNRCIISTAHVDGRVSAIEAVIDDVNSYSVTSSITWKAHDVRAVNIWLVSASDSIILTASVNGVCKLWRKSIIKENEYSYVAVLSLVTGRNEIATCCYYTALSLSDNLSYLYVGDSRGGISVYIVRPSDCYQFFNSGVESPVYPIGYHRGVHGVDPVSIITSVRLGDRQYLLSLGFDGFMNTYTISYPMDHIKTCLKDYPDSNAFMNHVYFEKTVSGKVLNQSFSPFNSISLTTKRSTLPIKSPDKIILSNISPSVEHVYIAGYVGSVYILWDIVNKYELLHVEGGSWKRAHDSALVFNNTQPRVTFLCPVPHDQDTLINIVTATSDLTCLKSLPLHLQSHGIGKVGYAGSIITCMTSGLNLCRQFIVVGGETGNALIYSCPSKPSNVLAFQSPLLQLDMPSNVSVKTTSVLQNPRDPTRGLLVASGGKLKYAIWSYSISSDIPLFQLESSGTLWPQATQDHRALSSDIGWLSSNSINNADDAFLVMLCDSRGVVTVGKQRSVSVSSEYSPTVSLIDQKLSILKQMEVSEYPILSCRLLTLSNAFIAVFGDTAGVVHVYILLLISSAGCYSVTEQLLTSYTAHSMGTNALDAFVCESEGNVSILNIVTGGDDQSITVYRGAFDRDANELQTLNIERVIDASTSAIKGLRVSKLKDMYVVASVGYDQRMNVWQLVTCEAGYHPQLQTPEIHTSLKRSTRLLWRTALITNISDVNSLCCSDVVFENDEAVCRVLAVGEGFELFTIRQFYRV